jgi:hypothetical protein
MTDGLLFVLTEPGVVPVAEFHDWYDNEHAPARLTVPGIRTGLRYRAADGQVPTWLAYYDLSLEALHSPEYTSVAVRSPREQQVVAGLAALDRRVYELVSDAGEVRDSPAPLVVCVGLTSEQPDELAAWYREEHVPMLLAIPGWRRTRRYLRREGGGPDHLALHEVDDPAVFDSAAYRAATSTARRERILGTVTDRWRRVFTYHGTVKRNNCYR